MRTEALLPLVEHVARQDCETLPHLRRQFDPAQVEAAFSTGLVAVTEGEMIRPNYWVQATTQGLEMLEKARAAAAEAERQKRRQREMRKRDPDYEVALAKAETAAELLREARAGIPGEARQVLKAAAWRLLEGFLMARCHVPVRYEAETQRLSDVLLELL